MTQILNPHAPFGMEQPRPWETQFSGPILASNMSETSSTSALLASAPVTRPVEQFSKSQYLSTAPLGAASQPRVHRRRGCQHCITCQNLTHHCHSVSVRSSHSPAAEWWPGGIHSPAVYYHLRAKQLKYAQKAPQRTGVVWRPVNQVNAGQSSLLARRNQGPLPVLVPSSYTNVSATDDGISYLGEKLVPLRKPGSSTGAPSQQRSAAVPQKRGIQTPLRSSRATWSHPEEAQLYLSAHRSSSDSIIADPKRRCTEQSAAASAGHFIARSSPQPPSSHAHSHSHRVLPVYPGVVMQRQGSGGLAVVTPPMAPIVSMAPLSAGSDRSATSAPSDMGWSAYAAPMPTHAAAVWEMTQSAPQQSAVESAVPVLMGSHSAPILDDPTMQQYYARQYNIKQEQAFPCHQVIDMSMSAPVDMASAAAAVMAEQQQHHESSSWTSMLRSLAGSFKRTLSP